MIVTWTITAGAIWAWSYSSTGQIDGSDNTVEGNTSTARTLIVTETNTDEGTFVSTIATAADQTATFYTSTLSEVSTTIQTTTTVFDQSNFISANILSASFDSDNGSIVTFYGATTATSTTQIATSTTILSTASSGTYLQPLDLPSWLDVNIGDGAYAPTVVAWSSAAGYSQPTASNANSSLPTAAALAFSGQLTLFPETQIFQVPSASDNGQPTGVNETWQSNALTWTEQATTNVTLTRAASGFPITRSTQSYQTTVYTTRTESSAFEKTLTYNTFAVAANVSFSSWWNSTALTNATYVISDSTTQGQTTTTSLTSSIARTFIQILGQGQSGQLPLAAFEISLSVLRGSLTSGIYSHFYTQNAGLALNATAQGRAAISDAGQSFPLPPQSFSTALYQRGVTAPLPFQTRSRTSSNSTTKWSLGNSALTITTSSSNSITQGGTTSTYALSAAGPTIWSASSRTIGNSYTAAGGHYATSSLFVGGGLFSATEGTSEFTGTSVSVGTAATAFQPLPHFVVEVGFPSAATVAPPVTANNIGFFGLRTLGFPLTA